MCRLIKELQPGMKAVQITLLCLEITEAATKAGKTYLKFRLADPEGAEITANLWDRNLASLKGYEKRLPEPWRFTFDVQKNGEYMNYNFARNPNDQSKLLPWGPDKEASMNQFRRMAPEKPGDMFQEILKDAEGYRSPLKEIVTGLYGQYIEELLKSVGGKRIHHAVYGGLLYHTVRMHRAAKALCTVYTDIDQDLLLAGVDIHDIGKLRELSTNELGVAEYTAAGSLLGHISIGHEILARFLWEKQIPENEDTMLLEHMILSHHGQLEWGSPVLPATRESRLLNHLDVIDSQDDQIVSALGRMESGFGYPLKGTLNGSGLYKRQKPVETEEQKMEEAGKEQQKEEKNE